MICGEQSAARPPTDKRFRKNERDVKWAATEFRQKFRSFFRLAKLQACRKVKISDWLLELDGRGSQQENQSFRARSK